MALIKIVSVDFYMSSPIQGLDCVYSEFRGSSVDQVPVIRIFGVTETGCKMCLHIHGVFPYIYIPFEGDENPASFMYQITTKLDQYINIAQGHASSVRQHVYKIVRVSGIPLYGYHRKEHQFLKIYFYNPLYKKKICNLLQNENGLGKVYQLHEAHIPFILQFMIDYNLHGMNYISLSEVKYRIDPENTQLNMSEQNFLPSHIKKISTCQIEADGLADHIVNRMEILGGQVGKNPGIAALWNDEVQRRINKGENSQISQCLSQDRVNIPPTESHNKLKAILKQRLSSVINEDCKIDKNIYVYPSETHKAVGILSASYVEAHSSSNCDISSNDTIDHTRDEVDQSLSMLDITLENDLNDTDAKELLDVLIDLGDKRSPEKGSILSQVMKDEQGSDEDNEIDMSLPFGDITTPIKRIEDTSLITTTEQNEQLLDHKSGKDIDCGDILVQDDDFINTATQSSSMNLNQPSISKNDITANNTTAVLNSQINYETGIERAKRKLSFVDMSKTQNSNYNSHNNTDEDSKSILESIKHDTDLQNDCLKKTLNQKLSQSSDELFPDDIEKESDIYISNTILKAKQYDIENYSISNLNLSKVNIKKSESVLLGSKSSGSTSYQHCSGKPIVSETESINFTYEDKVAEYLNHSNKSKTSIASCNIVIPKFNPPSRQMIMDTLTEYNIPEIRYQKPFYGDFADATGEMQVGHNVLKVNSVCDLSEFEHETLTQGLQSLRRYQLQQLYSGTEITSNQLKSMKLSFCSNMTCFIVTAKFPPIRTQVNSWLMMRQFKEDVSEKKEKVKLLVPCSPGCQSNSDDEHCISLSPYSPSSESVKTQDSMQETPKAIKAKRYSKIRKTPKVKHNNSNLCKMVLQSRSIINNMSCSEGEVNDSGQITVATPNNTYGFKMSLENLQKAKVLKHEYLTMLVMELHVYTRGDFKPDPQLDPIRAIFYSVYNDVPEGSNDRVESGVIACYIPDYESFIKNSGITCNLKLVDSEKNLIEEFSKIIKTWDPDIFAGYEVEMLSWGYLVERGYVLNLNLQTSLDRTQVKLNAADDEVNSSLSFTGRILLDVWRLMRHEISLQSYTFENMMYHVLHLRIPLYSFKDLSYWWEHKSSIYRHKTVNFYMSKVNGIIKLLDHLDIIGRTCELARLFGIQFYEVLSRGSQFRVESMMLRLAKPLNYVAVSPSVTQRAKMDAPEYLPLILEPESKLFTDPIIVLDFQSLYPSIIIAYNYCYSTCLGKVERLGQNDPFVFGTTQLKLCPRRIKQLLNKNLIYFSPCGVAFVKKKVRQGVLPRMLLEILDTRLMVKKSLKQNKDDKTLQRILQNRQLGLKLIANVTYGYTSANFSGRMPAVELGDSVVSKGRETLLRAIKLIENTSRWGAKVVYGDTDSVFVSVPGRSRECAFKIGAEIAQAVTNDNPSPVKLKLEKVYHPCMLQTKKRYVGYMYESQDQLIPEFNAKGIETVRRDGCPAASKMLEKSLKILFDTCDVSLVRKYVLRQFTKLLSGRISLQDLTFAKEYRGASEYRPGACVPALELARRWIAIDKRNEPRRGERVPYIIVNGPPGLPLIKLVRSPRDLLEDFNLIPNMTYYITKAIIPVLNRCFTLIGVDINLWFNNMPRKQMLFYNNITPNSTNKKGVISHYFAMAHCVGCNRKTQQGLCIECHDSPQNTATVVQSKIRMWERSFHEINLICESCAGCPTNMECISLDCPVLYGLMKAKRDLQQIAHMKEVTATALNL